MWRTRLEAIPVGPLGRQLAEWVIARHNFIVNQRGVEAFDQTHLDTLATQEQEVRSLIAQAGDAGALDEVLSQAQSELQARKHQLHTLTRADIEAFDLDTWTPENGKLPEEFDITMGRGAQRRRFVSVGPDQWAQIAPDSTQEDVMRLREEAGTGQEGGAEIAGDADAALMHAHHCLFETLASHLGRFAMGIGEGKETPHWSLSSEVLSEEHGRPSTHELVGMVASGNVVPSQFDQDSFKEILAERCDAQARDIQLVGALPDQQRIATAVFAPGHAGFVLDGGQAFVRRPGSLNVQQEAIVRARRALGVSAPEHFQDQHDHTILLFSVVRWPTQQQPLFGTPGHLDDEDSSIDEAWIERMVNWTDRHGMEGTYVLPPTPTLEAVARLGAVQLAGMGEGELATAAGIGRETSVDINTPIDVIGFDANNMAIARTQLPAWMFGLLEEALGTELQEMFNVQLDVLPPDHGLNLDMIPMAGDEDDGSAPPPPLPAKRTLH